MIRNVDSEEITVKYRIGWLAAVAFGIAGNISLFTLGPVLQSVGKIGILLFIVGMIVAWIGGFLWIKVILRHQDKVGGVAVNCFESYRTRSPLLLTLVCFGYWLSWVVQAAFSAQFCATAITEWLSLTQISSMMLSIGIMIFFIGCGLVKLTIVARIIVPIACVTVLLSLLSGILPILAGNVHWGEQALMSVQLPFAGWFGYLTVLMSGFYLVSWIVPAYEVTTCLAGEMKNGEKNIPKAFIVSGILSGLFFVLLPIIWLSVLGFDNLIADYTAGKNWLNFELLFPGFGKTFASTCGSFLIISFMLCSGIGSIVGPSRTLVQLAEYGLFPKIFQRRLENGAPWIAVGVAGLLSILTLYFEAPVWLMSATNFGYLSCMIIATLGVWLISKEGTENNVLNSSRNIELSTLVVCGIWFASIIFGYQQYGMYAVFNGILFIFLAILPYAWRKVGDGFQKGEKINWHSMNISLRMLFFGVTLLNVVGYLLALKQLPQTGSLVVFLNDIFVTVVLTSIVIGLLLTDSVAYASMQIAAVSRQLSQTTMVELVQAMKALGRGVLEKTHINFKKILLKSNRKDELGIMANSFDELETQVESVIENIDTTREQLNTAREELVNANQLLEKRVQERTAELSEQYIKLQTEMAEGLKTKESLAIASQQLLKTARMAGMAEVSTSVLHNVGNVLNSVNVSISLITEKITKSKISALSKVVELMQANSEHIAQFMSEDPKGKLLQPYIAELSHHLTEERESALRELKSLDQNIQHIKDIVKSQQSITGETGGVQEPLVLKKLLDDAIEIALCDMGSKGIHIKREYLVEDEVIIDKSKVMQILLNLMRNANDSVLSSKQPDKEIIVRVEKIEGDRMSIKVIDNGEGIAPENITRIFSFGFTTKETGHGFGLHSSALVARELRGSLNAYSDGVGKGATFHLILPFISKATK